MKQCQGPLGQWSKKFFLMGWTFYSSSLKFTNEIYQFLHIALSANNASSFMSPLLVAHFYNNNI